MAERWRAPVALRTLAATALVLVLGLLFPGLWTLLFLGLLGVIFAMALGAVADRLERLHVPRALGAFLTLGAVVGGLVLVGMLLGPAIERQIREMVDVLPAVVDDFHGEIRSLTGQEPGEVSRPLQEALLRLVDEPSALVGPVSSAAIRLVTVIGGVLAVLVIAYYLAARPEPLKRGLLRLFRPDRRAHAEHVMSRLRRAWLGWLGGTLIDMLATAILLYIGLTIIGVDYALVFAVLTGLLEFVPYLGPILASIPAILFALTDSVELAVLTGVVFLVVQQIEGHLILPLVMARSAGLHPALVAAGVIAIGSLFGLVGVLVAVPILSATLILVEEFWVRPREMGAEDMHPPAQSVSEVTVAG
jgi:predicted PurR-regulated permease PerM